MPHVIVSTLQTVWDCRWSRPGYLPRGVAEIGWPDSRWVCVRPCGNTVPRAVTEAECLSCPNWQAVWPDEHGRP